MLKLQTKIYILLILLLSSCFNQESDANSKEIGKLKETEPRIVNFCDLARSPESYDGKLIRLKGIYVLVYHFPRFISFNCKTDKLINLSSRELKPCDEESELENFDSSSAMADRAHGIIVVGRFNKEVKTIMVSFGKIEHYEFKVDCFEKIKQLGWLPLEPSKEQKERLEEFEPLGR
jgi:hypothetical protein